jgi:anaerobic magnesium-protoporphyrin IX monomethyl ester cyclase
MGLKGVTVMAREIDCLLIGHNEMDFEEYETHIRQMGIHSGAYRDLNLSFIQHRGKLYHASAIFNTFSSGVWSGETVKPLNMLGAFSAAVSYLGTFLHRRGYTFDYVISFQDEKEELAAKLVKDKIITIAIITTYYISLFPILEIMQFIRQYNKEARIIVGGPFISTQVRTQDPRSLEILFNAIGADIYVNSSQGETALVKIIQALKSGAPLRQINNIYYKAGSTHASTPLTEENNKLSGNMVDWALFADRVDDYANLRTAISCPFACAFCGSPQHAGQWQTADVDDIEKEFESLAKIESLKSVHFIEDTFNVPPERFKKILRMMIENKYRFKWHSYFRCQYADGETVELMKESGCQGVYLGLESGSNTLLKNMNKAVTVEKYLKGIALLKEYEILMHGNFIIGFPGETLQTVEETRAFIEESGIDFFRVQLWYCMPITPIWKEKEKYQIKGNSFEWSHRDMDSTTACDLIDHHFLTVKNPTWVPQYNFDINNVFQLMHHGIHPDRVKHFLQCFNEGIKEKLIHPAQKEIGPGILMKLKKACEMVSQPELSIIDQDKEN